LGIPQTADKNNSYVHNEYDPSSAAAYLFRRGEAMELLKSTGVDPKSSLGQILLADRNKGQMFIGSHDLSGRVVPLPE
jgi:hypothetical protein